MRAGRFVSTWKMWCGHFDMTASTPVDHEIGDALGEQVAMGRRRRFGAAGASAAAGLAIVR